MKNSKRSPMHATRVVCTDGSTINIDFPFNKNDIFLMNDLKNNPLYLTPLKDTGLRDLHKAKQKSLRFDFFTLLKDKK
jgi:hypothetical protein